ncbi:MAG: response regulator [Burkholderiales bacterium]|nr:response regulator [Burkholderiales bacterium]
MNEQLIWILAAALTVGVVVFLLWLGRRRQQRARDAAAHREAQRVMLEQAEHAARAQRVTGDLARETADAQALREVEAGLFQRLAEQRGEAEQLEAERQQAERDEAAQREARAQAVREAAETEARRLAEERAEAERLAREAAAEAAREAEAQAAREAAAAEAQRVAEERAEAERREAARLEAQRIEAEQREAAIARAAAEAERLAAEQRAEAERRDAERRAAEEAAAAAQATRELRADETLVLVADDSKIVRVKISRLLATQGYRVALAESGEQALELMGAERPHLLITDVEMPGIDGFELTRQLRAAPVTAALPIVMITSSDDKQAEAAAAGVTQLLGKPYSEEALIAAIEKARLAVRVPA